MEDTDNQSAEEQGKTVRKNIYLYYRLFCRALPPREYPNEEDKENQEEKIQGQHPSQHYAVGINTQRTSPKPQRWQREKQFTH